MLLAWTRDKGKHEGTRDHAHMLRAWARGEGRCEGLCECYWATSAYKASSYCHVSAMGMQRTNKVKVGIQPC